MNDLLKNNEAALIGEITTEAEFSHEVFGENFYGIKVKATRMSGVPDIIPVTISERMCNLKELCVGQRIAVYGQFRSFNRHEESKSRLILSLFAREVELLDDMQSSRETNEIFLDGYICKKPIYRRTPLGREIADALVAVNRPYGKSDYIPCIFWDRNARFVTELPVGSRILVRGRMQSRDYKKILEDGTGEMRTAYEVSVGKIDVVESEG